MSLLFLKIHYSLIVMPPDKIIRMAPAADTLNGPTFAAFFIFLHYPRSQLEIN